jgi:hypothetical protein
MDTEWRRRIDVLEAELAEALAECQVLSERLSDSELEAAVAKAQLARVMIDSTYVAG